MSQAVGASDELTQRVWLGPVAGLTNGWHLAPSRFAAPLGVTLLLEARPPRGYVVSWSGAVEVSVDEERSRAKFSASAPGSYAIRAVFNSTAGSPSFIEMYTVDVLSVSAQQVSFSAIQVAPYESASTAGWSAADVYGHGLSTYVTSVRRPLRLKVAVSPPEFGVLVEWRLDGQQKLGSEIVHAFEHPGEHRVLAGSPSTPQNALVETYRTLLTPPHFSNQAVAAGNPLSLQFSVRTEPAGHEWRVRWSARSRYGVAAVSAPDAQYAALATFQQHVAVFPCAETAYLLSVVADDAEVSIQRNADVSDPCADPCASTQTTSD